MSFNFLQTMDRKKKIILIACIAAVIVAAVAGFFIFQYFSNAEQQRQTQEKQEMLSADTFYPGIVVNGVDLGGKTMSQAKTALKDAEKSIRDSYQITIKYKEKTWTMTEDDLEFSYDTDKVLKEAFQYARTGEEDERYQKILALQETPKTYSISCKLDESSVTAYLDNICKEINVEPVDATVASFDPTSKTFQYEDGKNGLAVKTEEFYAAVNKLVKGAKKGTVEVPTEEVKFDVTAAQLNSHMQQLGTYTTYSYNTADGNYNMALALAATNGTVLQPGEVFSFNGTTGDTTTSANGYRKAGAISGGKMIQSYGGGICQAATTIYGAALRSNMEIVERYNHLWPSSYTPIGLDATVDYPYLDLKFRNNSKYPVYILAGMSGNALTVTFYGYQSPDYDEIRLSSWQTETVPQPADQLVTDNSLAPGQKVLDREGNAGRRAVAQRLFYKNGVLVKTEDLFSSYYQPVATIYKVGPGGSSSGNTSSSSKPSSTTPPPSSSSSTSSSSTPSSSSSSTPSSSSAPPSSSEASSSSSEASSIPETSEVSQGES